MVAAEVSGAAWQHGPARESLIVAARAEEVPVARAFIAELLGRLHPCTNTAVLLVSELVTNSVRHSGSRYLGQAITVTVILDGDRVRVEVTDLSGPAVPTVQARVDGLAEGGRGLQLVQALAASWGYRRHGRRTTTWFVCMP